MLIGAAYLVKLGPALLFRSVFPWRETWAAGTLLAARLSLIIAASAIALELRLITPPVNAAIILVAVVTCTLSPILFGRILGPGTEPARQGVIILGTGPLGRLLAGRLRRAGETITFIASDPQPLADLRQAGFATVTGDPRDPAVLAAGAAQATALISVTNAPDLVLAVCRQAKAQFGAPVLIANLDDPRYTRPLAALEVRLVATDHRHGAGAGECVPVSRRIQHADRAGRRRGPGRCRTGERGAGRARAAAGAAARQRTGARHSPAWRSGDPARRYEPALRATC